MAYRIANNLSPQEIKAARKLCYFQNNRVLRLRKRYPKELCPRLHSLSPQKLLIGNTRNTKGKDYLSIVQELARSAGVKIEEHGKQWVFVAKQFWIEEKDTDSKEYRKQAKQAYKLASMDNIRIQLKTAQRLTVQNAVVNTRVLRYLLALKDGRLLIPRLNSAFSLTMLAQIARKALKLPHFTHLDTTLILGLGLMGFRVSKGKYGRMVLDAQLILSHDKHSNNTRNTGNDEAD